MGAKNRGAVFLRNPPPPKQCPVCEQMFHAEGSSARNMKEWNKLTYCSVQCGRKMQVFTRWWERDDVPPKVCAREGCARPISPVGKDRLAFNRQRYCSVRCGAGHGHVTPKKDRPVLFCQRCGDQIILPDHYGPSFYRKRKFCGSKCTGKNNGDVLRKAPPEPRACLWMECGKAFTPDHRKRKQRFCSTDCARAYNNRLLQLWIVRNGRVAAMRKAVRKANRPLTEHHKARIAAGRKDPDYIRWRNNIEALRAKRREAAKQPK